MRCQCVHDAGGDGHERRLDGMVEGSLAKLDGRKNSALDAESALQWIGVCT